MEFDEILVHIGELGRYQIMVFLLSGVQAIFTAYATNSAVFIFGIPKYRCAIPGYENDTYSVQSDAHQRLINETIPPGSKCTIFDGAANETKCSSYVYEQLYYTPSVVMEFDLVCDKTFYRTILNTVFMFGQLVGNAVAGELSDRFGRRTSVLLAAFIQCVAGVASGLSPGIYTLAVCRFLFAAAGVYAYIALFVLVAELTGPSKRQKPGTGIIFFFSCGTTSLLPLAYFIRNWRHLLLVTGTLNVLLVSYWWLIPESARWLFTRGNYKASEKIIRKMARINRKELPENFRMELSVENPERKIIEHLPALLRNKICFIRLIIVTLNWIALSAAYYGLLLNSGNLTGNLYINYLTMVLVGIPANTFAFLAPHKFGRKKPHIFCLMVSGASLVASIFVVFLGKEGSPYTLPVLSAIGFAGVLAAFSSVYVYTAELFPTSTRQRCMAFCSTTGRIGSILAPYISDLGQLIESRFKDALPLIVLGPLCLAAGILCIFLPETYGKRLPETINDAASMGSTRRICGCGAAAEYKMGGAELKACNGSDQSCGAGCSSRRRKTAAAEEDKANEGKDEMPSQNSVLSNGTELHMRV